jgi:lysophospholipase L1-like esterase
MASILSCAHAAESPVGIVEDPCPQPFALPSDLQDRLIELFLEPRQSTAADMEQFVRDPRMAELERVNRQRLAMDWPALCRYRAANQAALNASNPPRVVFMGDSITENWVLADPAFFDKGIIGRGISGQTTPQMLVRFRADVVALRPKAVHILAGTNDVAGNTGPTTAQDYKNNVMSMVELAKAHEIAVILGSIPPAAVFSWRPEMKPAPRIAELNAWLRNYASQERVEFIDYHAALAGSAGELRADLGNDGVHPNRKGYALMRKLVQVKLSGALASTAQPQGRRRMLTRQASPSG